MASSATGEHERSSAWGKAQRYLAGGPRRSPRYALGVAALYTFVLVVNAVDAPAGGMSWWDVVRVATFAVMTPVAWWNYLVARRRESTPSTPAT